MDAKPWYESKTILVNVVMGLAMILGVFAPAWGDFLKQYFAEAGMGWAFLNILLRAITKDKISIS